MSDGRGAEKIRELVYLQIDPIIDTRTRIKQLQANVREKREALGVATSQLDAVVKEGNEEFEALIYLLNLSDIHIPSDDSIPNVMKRLKVAEEPSVGGTLEHRIYLEVSHGLMRDIKDALAIVNGKGK